MSRNLQFELQWMQRHADDLAEQASFAALRITGASLVLTEGYDTIAQTVRGESHVSIVHLGRWLAANWWRLRHEPESPTLEWRLAHDLPAAGGGFLWPPLRISSDGESIRLAPLEPPERATMFQYRQQQAVWVPAAAFERGVDTLMEALLARLDTRKARDPDLLELWQLILVERADPELSRLRRREALLGAEPDSLELAELQKALQQGAWMGEASLDEVVATTSYDRLTGRIAGLTALRDVQRPHIDLRPVIESLLQPRTRAPGASSEEAPWERGDRFAHAVRAGLGAGHGPLLNERMEDVLGVALGPGSPLWITSDPRDRSLAIGFRDAEQPSRVRAWMRSPHPRGRRFELARLLGDALMGASGEVALPLTDRATARQKAQRAFAQELLCPEAALRSELPPNPTELDVADLADRYDVSEYLIVSALQNRRLVPRDYFAARER
jgi:hypothetical protein